MARPLKKDFFSAASLNVKWIKLQLKRHIFFAILFESYMNFIHCCDSAFMDPDLIQIHIFYPQDPESDLALFAVIF